MRAIRRELKSGVRIEIYGGANDGGVNGAVIVDFAHDPPLSCAGGRLQ
jgi:hypothetical protein